MRTFFGATRTLQSTKVLRLAAESSRRRWRRGQEIKCTDAWLETHMSSSMYCLQDHSNEIGAWLEAHPCPADKCNCFGMTTSRFNSHRSASAQTLSAYHVGDVRSDCLSKINMPWRNKRCEWEQTQTEHWSAKKRTIWFGRGMQRISYRMRSAAYLQL